jgi:hypothetical protein
MYTMLERKACLRIARECYEVRKFLKISTTLKNQESGIARKTNGAHLRTDSLKRLRYFPVKIEQPLLLLLSGGER